MTTINTLEEFNQADYESLYAIYQALISEGNNYPHEIGSREEFDACFFAENAKIYVYKIHNTVIGGFYLKPNFPGRGKHICNAAYMIHKLYRGQGFGKSMVKASLLKAKQLGYKGMQFNIVLSHNLPAVNLYRQLNFSIIGTIPSAIRNQDNSYQDGYIMYHALDCLMA